jgi:CheY-like chemotaxis protein
MAQPRLNLKNVSALIADRDPFTRGLLAQMLKGFGIVNILIPETGAEAKQILAGQCPDLIFVEAELPDMPAADLIVWIRRNANKALRYQPVLVLSGYTQLRLIQATRNAGAHLVIRKPVSPQALFDRLVWVAGFDRPFVETPNYAGPDRRWRAISPPDGAMKREEDSPKPKAAEA